MTTVIYILSGLLTYGLICVLGPVCDRIEASVREANIRVHKK